MDSRLVSRITTEGRWAVGIGGGAHLRFSLAHNLHGSVYIIADAVLHLPGGETLAVRRIELDRKQFEWIAEIAD